MEVVIVSAVVGIVAFIAGLALGVWVMQSALDDLARENLSLRRYRPF